MLAGLDVLAKELRDMEAYARKNEKASQDLSTIQEARQQVLEFSKTVEQCSSARFRTGTPATLPATGQLDYSAMLVKAFKGSFGEAVGSKFASLVLGRMSDGCMDGGPTLARKLWKLLDSRLRVLFAIGAAVDTHDLEKSMLNRVLSHKPTNPLPKLIQPTWKPNCTPECLRYIFNPQLKQFVITISLQPPHKHVLSCISSVSFEMFS